MFCKNCGNAMAPQAAVCIKCGCAAGTGTNYCPNCGQPTTPNASVCIHCGVALTPPVPTGEQKSKLVAGLLGLFLGGYGVHNFYLGYTGKAVTQLVISVLGILLAFLFFGIPNFIVGIWALIEAIMILCGNIKTDAKGVPLKE